MPHGEGLGVSRRLEDDERPRLKDILKELAPKEGGVIVRTAAEGASAEDIERDLVFLQRLWKTIQAKAKTAKAPALIYQEAELPLRVTRDLFTGDFERRYVDDDRTLQAHRRLPEEDLAAHGRARRPLQGARRRSSRRSASTPRSARRSTRRVDLPSGGYLIFDYAEAFTVIDVNTGRFVGSRSKTLGRTARGHDHEEQPRGREGGRAPAAAARHRRDHRHRLHRHGEPEEPRVRRGGAAHGARARPDEDLRRRDLAARARRDDAAERDRRPARDPDAQVPHLRGRRDRRLGGAPPRSTSSGSCARSSAGSRAQAFRIEVHRARSPRCSSAPAGSGWRSSRR